MSWSVHRLIFRLDFATPCFAIADHLGRIAEEIKQFAVAHKAECQKMGIRFSSSKPTIDIKNETEDEIFNLVIEPKFSVLSLDFLHGKKLSGLHQARGVILADHIHEEIMKKKLGLKIYEFERIGFRIFSLQTKELGFKNCLSIFEKQQKFTKNFANLDAQLKDVAFIYEFDFKETTEKARLAIGPYDQIETRSELIFPNYQPAGTGILSDLDLYSKEEKIQNFRYFKNIELKAKLALRVLSENWGTENDNYGI